MSTLNSIEQNLLSLYSIQYQRAINKVQHAQLVSYKIFSSTFNLIQYGIISLNFTIYTNKNTSHTLMTTTRVSPKDEICNIA